jgi:hypothetical protein
MWEDEAPLAVLGPRGWRPRAHTEVRVNAVTVAPGADPRQRSSGSEFWAVSHPEVHAAVSGVSAGDYPKQLATRITKSGMMASTGPAARIPAEAQDTPTSLLAREASELRQTEFYSVGPVFLLR